MARWYENLKTDNANAVDSDGGRLIGEVSHAAGNLVHRMYYWTGVLEEIPAHADSREASAEAVRQLKDSLAGLHRLVNRTMSLIRPVKMRPITVPASDVVLSIALRLGTDRAAAAAQQLDPALEQTQVSVDPIELDRAVGMLGEALSPAIDDPADAAPRTLTVHRAEPSLGSASETASMIIEVACERVPHPADQPYAAVSSDLSVALATRVLAVLGWRVELAECERQRRIILDVPISDTSAATTTNGLEAPL